jgi:type IV pilus assembly protein PilA
MKKFTQRLLKNEKGFTLIELIIVIAIIAILAAIAIPKIVGYVEKSQISTDISNAQNIANAAMQAIADDDLGDISSETELSDSNLDPITDRMNSEPEVKLDGYEDEFYVKIDDKNVTVYVKETSGSSYVELYPDVDSGSDYDI